MNGRCTLLTAALAATAFAADDIQIAGKLVDEANAPLAGATVALDGLVGTTTTGTDGTFLLSGSSSDITSVRRVGSSRSLALAVRGGSVRIVGADDGAAWTLDAYRPDGRALARGIAFRDGVASLPAHAAGNLILQVRRDGVLSSAWSRSGSGSAQRAFSASSPVLRFSKTGFAPSRIALDSYVASDLLDTLVASDPWLPSGSLVHDKGQVKVLAKGRTFAMGSKVESAEELTASEGPRHSVSFTYDFWMDTTETTQKDWVDVMTAHYGNAFSATLLNAGYGKGDNYPVYSIYEQNWSAGGAILYANALSARDGLDSVYTYESVDAITNSSSITGLGADLSKNGYRLPTEAEWEYAARGGTTTDTYWGMDFEESLDAEDSAAISQYAVWAGNAFAFGYGNAGYGIAPVASRKPNAYGLYDMIGNLTEWCHDAWTASYEAGHQVDPSGQLPTSENPYHVARGGNWGNGLMHLRSANRTFQSPEYQIYFVGFRLVRKAD